MTSPALSMIPYLIRAWHAQDGQLLRESAPTRANSTVAERFEALYPNWGLSAIGRALTEAVMRQEFPLPLNTSDGYLCRDGGEYFRRVRKKALCPASVALSATVEAGGCHAFSLTVCLDAPAPDHLEGSKRAARQLVDELYASPDGSPESQRVSQLARVGLGSDPAWARDTLMMILAFAQDIARSAVMNPSQAMRDDALARHCARLASSCYVAGLLYVLRATSLACLGVRPTAEKVAEEFGSYDDDPNQPY